MSRRGPLATAAALAAAIAAAGCGTVNGQAGRAAGPPPQPPGLATTLVTPGATWAVAVLGGPAASHNNFWQLFVRPATSASWRLATPPGVASNGGLVLAAPGGAAGSSVIAGFRPSQDLAFTPLATSGDNGAAWSPAVLDARLADVPDALAAAPGGSRLAALAASGEVMQASRADAAWSRLASPVSAARSPAARRCGLSGLAAVSFSPSGAALLAGTCDRPGAVGIFSYDAGTWQAAAPALPAALAGRRIQVLRLTRTPAGEVALLAARSGRSTDLLAAWNPSGGAASWTLSAPVSLDPAGSASPAAAGPASAARLAGTVRSSGFGAGGAIWVLLSNGSALAIAGSGAAWQLLPPTPPHTAALAFGPVPGPAGGLAGQQPPGGSAVELEALAARGSTLTDWRLAAGSASWRAVQVVRVPISYGSSG